MTRQTLKFKTMKVSEFKKLVNGLEFPVEVAILDLFFGNRPQSVSADAFLTKKFLELKNIDNPDIQRSSCIIITNTEPVSEEDKKLPPREFVNKNLDEFEIAVQIL